MKKEILNILPYVELWHDFLSSEELQTINFNQLDFIRSSGYSFTDNESKTVEHRTSSTNYDDKDQTAFIRIKIFETLNSKKDFPYLELEHVEKMQITEYKSNQFYKPHFDFYNTIGWEGTVDNDRRATVIVYLNDNFTEGHTDFIELGLSVKPKAGMALYWRYDYDSITNAKTLHGGNSVGEGVKYITQAFIRNDIWYQGTTPKKK